MPKVPIAIKGKMFTAKLIVLESLGLDVILGMYFSSKHDGQLCYATKTMQLTHTDGTKVEYG